MENFVFVKNVDSKKREPGLFALSKLMFDVGNQKYCKYEKRNKYIYPNVD